MRTLSEIKDNVLVKSQATTTMAFYTDTILDNLIENAYQFVAGYKKWPFTEGRVSTTFSGNEENTYPEGWRPDSIRIMQIGGKRLTKTEFQDYQVYKEDRSSGQDKIFSDFGLLYFVNTQSGVSGTTTMYGQFFPAALDKTDPNATTVFTDRAPELNEAIAEKTISAAKLRERKPAEANLHQKRALAIIESVWKSIQDEQYAYQAKDRNMFKRLDVLEGVTEDELFKRDQWY